MMRTVVGVVCSFALAGCVADVAGDAGGTSDKSTNSANGAQDATGFADTFFASSSAQTGSFFGSLGTNGRTCNSCHVREDGWSIAPASLAKRFDQSGGTDPVFRIVDGANAPNADVSTVNARRAAYSMLLKKGVLRVGIGIPAGAEFSLVAVDDPYHYASAAQLSLFRRPLPTTSTPFLTAVMWDGRETAKRADGTIDLTASLSQQAIDATLGHAQATGASRSQLTDAVAFETQTFTAQTVDQGAGQLDHNGAAGGPVNLANTPFHVGINDVLSPGFDPNAMTLFDAWKNEHNPHRAAIYRGQQIFNTHPIAISGVKGLNDVLGVATLQGTCTTCHDTPNIGNHSVIFPIDIGVADASRRTPDMPLYTLKNNATGATIQTTDPGRALITGKWADIGKFKGPILRGLGLRAPYFHNGMAASLKDVVDFYNTRFGIGLSPQEQSDLLAFLQCL